MALLSNDPARLEKYFPPKARVTFRGTYLDGKRFALQTTGAALIGRLRDSRSSDGTAGVLDSLAHWLRNNSYERRLGAGNWEIGILKYGRSIPRARVVIHRSTSGLHITLIAAVLIGGD